MAPFGVALCLMGTVHAAPAERPGHRLIVIHPHQDAPKLLPRGPKILVIGSASPASFAQKRSGIRFGRRVAQREGIVVTGGCLGLPDAAVRGAHGVGGRTLAVAPWATMEALQRSGDPIRGFTHILLTKIPKRLERLGVREASFNHWAYRQTHNTFIADAVLVTPGEGGTIGELGNALVLKRPIAVLDTPGQRGRMFTKAMRALAEFHRLARPEVAIDFFKRPEKAAEWLMDQIASVEPRTSPIPGKGPG